MTIKLQEFLLFVLLHEIWGFYWHFPPSPFSLFIHRNALSRKYRRHLNDGQRNSANLGNTEKGTERSTVYRVTHTISQLRVELSDMHTDNNGKVEVTCLATIPARVLPGEEYADYRTVSEKSKSISFIKKNSYWFIMSRNTYSQYLIKANLLWQPENCSWVVFLAHLISHFFFAKKTGEHWLHNFVSESLDNKKIDTSKYKTLMSFLVLPTLFL